MKRHLFKKQGFTLIELLVVISVISFLATTIVISIDNARKKSRDSRRAADIKQLQTALDLYYHDHGYYPQTAGYEVDPAGFVHDCANKVGQGWEPLFKTELASYLSSVPHDPLWPDNNWPFCYYYKLGDYVWCSGTGHSYTIIFSSESSIFDLKKYDKTGEGASARYCIQPD